MLTVCCKSIFNCNVSQHYLAHVQNACITVKLSKHPTVPQKYLNILQESLVKETAKLIKYEAEP